MHYRNRLYNLMRQPLDDNPIVPSFHIQENGKISFSPLGMPEDEIIYDLTSLPPIITLQGTVRPTFHENDKTFVKATKDATPYCLYDKNYPQHKKAISKIEIITDEYVHSSNDSREWINFIDTPKVLFSNNFEVLREGTHSDSEKRSLQENIPEQSLWSYGGTYSADFDVCQVMQTNFFTILVDGETKIRSKKPQNAYSVGDLIQNGKIKIFLKNQKKQYYYQSFFIKNITPLTVHIHLKKTTTTPNN